MNTERQPGTQTLSITTIEYTDPKKSERESIGVLPIVAGIASAESVLSKEPQADIENKPTTPEPTESQLFWRNMYQTGELSPYKKNRASVKFDAVKEVFTNPTAKSFSEHVMAIDKDFRGGVDIGDGKVRLQRMATMVGNMAPFMAFDIATSIPSNLVFEYLALKKNDLTKTQFAGLEGVKKIIEVGNDKYVTALADAWVEKLTGEKGGWTREASDKTGDFADAAIGDRFEDFVNGPVVESTMRFLYQIPVTGALIEQAWTRLTFVMEKSAFHKATGKSLFAGFGLFIGILRNKKDQERKSPSALISARVWKALNVK